MNQPLMQLNRESLGKKLMNLLFEYKVMIVFAVICVAAFVLSQSTLEFVVDGVFTRLARNGFTVLALIIPVLAGMGLNFGIVIGAIAAQIAVFWVVYWGLGGFTGMLLSIAIATPLAIFFGYLVGKLFNQMKGAEMIAGLILGFFADGLYQLLFLVIIGGVIPVNNPRLIIDGGVGVKNTIDLADNLKYSLDNMRMVDILSFVVAIILLLSVMRLVAHLSGKRKMKRSEQIQPFAALAAYGLSYVPFIEDYLMQNRIKLLDVALISLVIYIGLQVKNLVARKVLEKDSKYSPIPAVLRIVLAIVLFGVTYIPRVEQLLLGVKLPILPFVLIAGLTAFNRWILSTRIGQNMRTVGQSQTVATASGINVDRTRIIAMVLSTVLACWGQLIYLQNIGTFSTYGAHLQIGQFAVAALLVGGASVSKASNKQAIIGVLLFHTLFIVAPQAGKNLFGDAMIGEYFRVFASYGVIALSLAMHAWKKSTKKVKVAKS